MAHKRSAHLTDLIDAISRINNAEEEWPAGWSNPILNDVLRKTKLNLQDGLVEIMREKKGGRSSGKKKAASQGETSRT